VNKIAKDFQLW